MFKDRRSALQDHEVRDAADAEARGQRGVLFGIDLQHEGSALHGLGGGLDLRRRHATRPTPPRPKVHEHGHLGALDHIVEAERVYRAGLVSDARLVDAFVSLGATDATNLVLAGTPPPAALGAFNRALAERHRALPLAVERRRLVVALLDPSDTATLERLSFTCGLVIEPRACRARGPTRIFTREPFASRPSSAVVRFTYCSMALSGVGLRGA